MLCSTCSHWGPHLGGADCLRSQNAACQLSCKYLEGADTQASAPPIKSPLCSIPKKQNKNPQCPGLGWGLRHVSWQLCLDTGLGPYSQHAPDSRREVSLGPQSGWFQKASVPPLPGISVSAHRRLYEERGVLCSRASSFTPTSVTLGIPLATDLLMPQYSWLTRYIYRVPGSVLGAGDVTMNKIDKASVLSGVTFIGARDGPWLHQ